MSRQTSLSRSLAAAIAFVTCCGFSQPAFTRQSPPHASPGQAQQSPSAPATTQSELPGVRNFTRIDATIACGGAVKPESYADIKKAGFASVVNLRAATEEGADVEAAQKAAEAAGLVFIHLPFSSSTPDHSKVDAFLAAYATSSNQPMLVHCASGGRASVFWAIKRVMVDGWPVEKAMGELPELGKNASDALKKFVFDYLKAHGK
jgi:uncharacterized protein (TIGR01244 family)